MNFSIKEVAERLKGMRDILNISIEEMCEKTGVSVDDYQLIEQGEKDFSVTFVYKCAEIFDVDIIEFLTGENPKLEKRSVVKKGKGLPVKIREGFEYQHLAYLFKDKNIETFYVIAPYNEEEHNKPIPLSSHEGQEFDYIISGSLKTMIDGKMEILNAGDSVIYDSSAPHGMIAANGEKCEFLAILIK